MKPIHLAPWITWEAAFLATCSKLFTLCLLDFGTISFLCDWIAKYLQFTFMLCWSISSNDLQFLKNISCNYDVLVRPYLQGYGVWRCNSALIQIQDMDMDAAYLLHDMSYFIIRFLYKVLPFTCVTILINEVVTAANRTLWYNGIIIQVSVQHWVPVSCPLEYRVSRYRMPQLYFKGVETNSRVRWGKKNLKVLHGWLCE